MNWATAIIPNGQALSEEIDLIGSRLLGIVVPSSWTAANLTFEGAVGPSSAGGGAGEFLPIHLADGTEFSITAAAGRFIVLRSEEIIRPRLVKVRSGTAAAPVNQAAERRIHLALGD